MAEPGRASDCVTAFREGVEAFCEKNKAEIMVWLRTQWIEDLRMMQAELMAIRAPEKETHR